MHSQEVRNRFVWVYVCGWFFLFCEWVVNKYEEQHAQNKKRSCPMVVETSDKKKPKSE